ncbi:glycoside hydrolase family 3 N-terminal domain-containing protein [Brachybacterium sp. AOP42-C2-15]|uniref:glycoside hydrolase family 3 N-terminal domain-containing protein n=1 Tax=unclassified Brachybacterium TaxID=2623841 RepID=UPI0040347F21
MASVPSTSWLETRAILDASDVERLEHARALVRAMDIEEKLPFLHQHSPGVERLGIGPFSTGTEALHGVAWRGPAVTYPQPVGLAATWDADLLEAVGEQIAREVRVHHGHEQPASLNVWAPVVNPLRHPLWGRNEEGLSEDPLLNARLGSAIARGLRGAGPVWATVPTLKHFLGYSHEVDRAATSSELSPRVLHEYELPGFEEALASGAAGAVMLSYNFANGVPAHLSPLVNDHLRHLVGDPDLLFVVSDAGAPTNLFSIQGACADLTEAVAAMLRAGVDSFTDHDRDSGPTIRAARAALEASLIQERHIDQAVVRQLVLRARTGELPMSPSAASTAPNSPSADRPAYTFDREAATALSEQVAARAAVLLKHDNAALPARSGSTIAVLGYLGGTVLQDWYSGDLVDPVPLDVALAAEHDGPVRSAACLDVIQLLVDGAPLTRTSADGLRLSERPSDVPRLPDARAGSIDPVNLEVLDHGHGVLSLRELRTGLWLAPDGYGYVRASSERIGGWSVQETFRALRGPDGQTRLQHVASGCWVRSERQTGKLILGTSDPADALPLTWHAISTREEQARRAVDGADLVIAVVGNEPHVNGRETEDRTSLALSDPDRRLVELLPEPGSRARTALLLVSSYPYDLGVHADAAEAVLWSSHAGARQGPALAWLLLGHREFSGRLAQSWVRESALTDILEYDMITSGATYLYDQPAQFAFGHGLTLAPTQWTHPSVEVNGDEIQVAITLERNATTTAHEVVQVYASTDSASYTGVRGAVPLLRLIGAHVAHVPASGSARVTFTIPWSLLRLWSDSGQVFTEAWNGVTIHLARSAGSLVCSRQFTSARG